MAERPNELPSANTSPIAEPIAGDRPDAVVIRAEIAETRAQMGDTLDEIGERLRPSHLKQQIGQEIHDATVGRVEDAARSAVNRLGGVGHRLVDTVRDNPIPAAMIGIGLGWLLWGQRHSPEQHAASQPKADSQHGTNGVAERASEAAEKVADRARDVASTVTHDARESARFASRQFNNSPIAVGVVALAVGVAAGLAIPETRREHELMGAARDKLVDGAKEIASDAKEKLQTQLPPLNSRA
jgi:hypothetical protein